MVTLFVFEINQINNSKTLCLGSLLNAVTSSTTHIAPQSQQDIPERLLHDDTPSQRLSAVKTLELRPVTRSCHWGCSAKGVSRRGDPMAVQRQGMESAASSLSTMVQYPPYTASGTEDPHDNQQMAKAGGRTGQTTGEEPELCRREVWQF